MVLLETITHSFIVKVWLEYPPAPANSAVWRGHITHIPSQRRQSLNDLKQITDFMTPILQASEQNYLLSDD